MKQQNREKHNQYQKKTTNRNLEYDSKPKQQQSRDNKKYPKSIKKVKPIFIVKTTTETKPQTQWWWWPQIIKHLIMWVDTYLY